MQFIDDSENTLPNPGDVERAFREHAGDGVSATIVDYALVWNPLGKYELVLYQPDHVGPKRQGIAVPVTEAGAFVDLLLLHTDCSDFTVCGTQWLGRDNLKQPTVRLHATPNDWYDAGCEGACHVARTSRVALQELKLQKVATILCSDMNTAMEAWDWGFAGDESELSRFVVDATPEAVQRYFEDGARWQTRHVAMKMEATL
jgi:hypothetical protein